MPPRPTLSSTSFNFLPPSSAATCRTGKHAHLHLSRGDARAGPHEATRKRGQTRRHASGAKRGDTRAGPNEATREPTLH
eukprot:216554-Chlamydomonas_euryale.AAC.2